jgi:hypothetical protein
MMIALDAIILLKKLKSGKYIKELYLGFDEKYDDINTVMENKRPLKLYLKEIYVNIL